MELLDFLMDDDVMGFNMARGTRARPNLFGADLAKRRLSGTDFSDANLEKADLTGADFSQTILNNAALHGIDGTNATFTGSVACRARLKEAWLENADLSESDFSGADFAGAVLNGSQARNASFRGARLSGVEARDVNWEGVDLSEVQLKEGDLSNANIRRGDFTGVRAEKCSFSKVMADGATFSEARLSETNFEGASLNGARFCGADLEGADFSGAQLLAADFSGANMRGVKIAGATLRGAVFVGACVDGIDFSGLDLEGADFTGLDVSALGLTAEQEQVIARSGVRIDPDAPVSYESSVVCESHGVIGLVWRNPEGEENSTIRWSLTTKGQETGRGVFPVLGITVRQFLVHETESGFLCTLLGRRAHRSFLVGYSLSLSGEISFLWNHPLEQKPIPPIKMSFSDDEMLTYGMVRQGPSLVIHRGVDGGCSPVFRQAFPTAVSFVDGDALMIRLKGGTLIPIDGSRPQSPIRVPKEADLDRSQVSVVEDHWLFVWPGANGESMRYAATRLRGSAELGALETPDGIEHFDVQTGETGVWVVWAGKAGSRPKTTPIGWTLLPSGEQGTFRVPEKDVASIKVIKCTEGQPLILLQLGSGALKVVDFSGEIRADYTS